MCHELKDDVLPRRPLPPPLPVQMCNVSDYLESSSSEEEDVIVTKYGKQIIFVSNYCHVFKPVNDNEVSISFLCNVY